ncbi:hypothetical protein CEXT_805001 [Caerostris extrusa]|uniref:Uncharacterized protein n=1 Tax=Caerostris extrusa TaxID=172846 RepID=A0AAV4P7Q6_CAEEX|nr:hypothetical protein CEXT_805001 [Caerostris extrusa]
MTGNSTINVSNSLEKTGMASSHKNQLEKLPAKLNDLLLRCFLLLTIDVIRAVLRMLTPAWSHKREVKTGRLRMSNFSTFYCKLAK